MMKIKRLDLNENNLFVPDLKNLAKELIDWMEDSKVSIYTHNDSNSSEIYLVPTELILQRLEENFNSVTVEWLEENALDLRKYFNKYKK